MAGSGYHGCDQHCTALTATLFVTERLTTAAMTAAALFVTEQ